MKDEKINLHSYNCIENGVNCMSTLYKWVDRYFIHLSEKFAKKKLCMLDEMTLFNDLLSMNIFFPSSMGIIKTIKRHNSQQPVYSTVPGP